MSKTYTTIQGDMWDSIAYTQLGSVDRVDRLMALNAQYLDIYIFPAGIELKLPDSVKVDRTALPWKAVSG